MEVTSHRASTFICFVEAALDHTKQFLEKVPVERIPENTRISIDLKSVDRIGQLGSKAELIRVTFLVRVLSDAYGPRAAYLHYVRLMEGEILLPMWSISEGSGDIEPIQFFDAIFENHVEPHHPPVCSLAG